MDRSNAHMAKVPPQLPVTEVNPHDDWPPVRAFVVTSGFVFQVFGWLLVAVGGCALAALAFIEPASTAHGSWLSELAPDRIYHAAPIVLAILALTGGGGLAAVGIGLYAERRSAGRDALIVSVILVVLFVSFALVVFRTDRWMIATIAMTLTVGLLGCALLALRCLVVLRRFPPPSDLHRVTEEVLETMRRERFARRSK